MTRNRLEAFSDGVIAIIITIMVLELKAPKELTTEAFLKILPVFLSYTLSFLIVAVYWVNHHHLIHLVQKVDGCMLWSNIHLLFWMSLIPWTTDCLGENHGAPVMVRLYIAVAVACGIAFFLLQHSVARTQQHDPVMVKLHRKMARKNFVAIGIYLAAIAASFVSVPLAIFVMALPVLMYFIPERAVEKRAED